MSTNIKDALKECSEISKNVMSKVDSKLSEDGIAFIHSNQSEIIVENKTKNDITGIISDIDGLSEENTKLLLNVTETNGNVFIRQKFN